MPTIQIELPELHPGQLDIINNAKRFNVARCGRRFGKTFLAADLLIDPALDGYPTGYFTPIYKTLLEIWEQVIKTLEPIIKRKNTVDRRIELITGGIIEFWSLKHGDAPRGRKYKRIIVDEAAFILDLKNKFDKVLRPMLADFKGDAYFFSSPIDGTDFQELDEKSNHSDKWASFHKTIYDNPNISFSEIEEIKSDTPGDAFAQEYMAEYVVFNGKLFATSFKESMIVQDNSIAIDPYYPLILSFDFNINLSCLVQQIIETPTGYEWRTIDEHHRDGGLVPFAEGIKEIYDELGVTYIINGDATGQAKSAETNGNASAYEQIRDVFKMGVKEVVRFIPTVNPGHYNSYVDYNHALDKVTVKINKRCENFILDLKRVKVLSEKGRFQIDKSDIKRGHLLDCSRYTRYSMLPKLFR
jgi:hypothetical protein